MGELDEKTLDAACREYSRIAGYPCFSDAMRLALKAAFAAAPAPTVSGEADWKRAFAAQSRKLQAVLHIPGVKEELASLDWPSGDPTPTRAEVLESYADADARLFGKYSRAK